MFAQGVFRHEYLDTHWKPRLCGCFKRMKFPFGGQSGGSGVTQDFVSQECGRWIALRQAEINKKQDFFADYSRMQNIQGKKQAANPGIQNSLGMDSTGNPRSENTGMQTTPQKTKKDGDTRYTRGEERRGNRW